MKYVYLLKSVIEPGKKYVGITSDLNTRLKEHNAGKSPHTAKFEPWKIVVAIRFTDNRKAEAFEKYIKSGSGCAFAKRHFWYCCFAKILMEAAKVIIRQFQVVHQKPHQHTLLFAGLLLRPG